MYHLNRILKTISVVSKINIKIAQHGPGLKLSGVAGIGNIGVRLHLIAIFIY